MKNYSTSLTAYKQNRRVLLAALKYYIVVKVVLGSKVKTAGVVKYSRSHADARDT